MRTLLAALAVLLAGCVTVDIGGESAAHTQYVLEDANPSPQRRAEPVADALVIQSEGGDPLADSLSIVYSRRAGERAQYQRALWTDRPSRRIPLLLQRRLEKRGSFRAVALLGQPLHSHWLLAVAAEDVYHDVATEPGRARVTVRATLFDRRQRALAAQRTFSADVPVAAANSAAAVAAINQAVAQVLDALGPWIEQEVARSPATEGHGRARS